MACLIREFVAVNTHQDFPGAAQSPVTCIITFKHKAFNRLECPCLSSLVRLYTALVLDYRFIEENM